MLELKTRFETEEKLKEWTRLVRKDPSRQSIVGDTFRKD